MKWREMYKHSVNQLEFENFYLPFGGHLRSDNRWVKLAKLIPWEEIERDYAQQFSSNGMGAPALSVRVAVGSLIIKEMLKLSDEEAVEQIRENPYLQYFIGYSEYRDEYPFDPSMYVHFRKRLSSVMAKFNDKIISCAQKSQPAAKRNEDDRDNGNNAGGRAITGELVPDAPKNSGKLILDATCAPADITYPTDLKLLNDAREKTETIIDTLYGPLCGQAVKPRTYRKKARKDYLKAAKSRNLTIKKRRKAVGRQLNYVRRNLNSIDKLLKHPDVKLQTLSRYEYKCLLVISEVYRQQHIMYSNSSCQIEDRIVSISQPHVRPIVRGKAGAKVEFRAKVAASVVDGYIRFDHIEWDSFNESQLLQSEVERYRERYGCYPESLHVDKIYRSRENLKFCKERHIRMSGPPLGRPPKITDENRNELEAAKAMARKDEIERIPIEGKFGQGKRRFGLAQIMTKLADTSICAILISAVAMNLIRWLKCLFLSLFYALKYVRNRFITVWISLCYIYVEISVRPGYAKKLLFY